eukprot:scaffold3967_cov179-Amphora_coffeaeformis.AAC.3
MRRIQQQQAQQLQQQSAAAALASKRPLDQICIPSIDVPRLVAEVQQSLTTKQRLTVLRRIQREILGANTTNNDNDTNNNNNNSIWRRKPADENQNTARAVIDDCSTRIDWFIELGGFRVLIQQLGLVLDRQATTIAHEIHTLVGCLDDLARQSSSSSTSAHTGTTNDTREIILETMDLDLLERAWVEWKCPAIPSLAHWISACTTGTYLLFSPSSGLVRHLIPLLASSSSSSSSLGKQQHAELLGCLKNITYFDRQGKFMGEPGFLTNLTTMSLTTTAISMANTERVSAIWRNLALLHECRSRLKQQVDMCHVLYTLATTASLDDTSNHSNNKHTAAIHRNVLSAMVNLSMDQDVCVAFLLYRDGLYTTLLQRLLTSLDSTTRKRAARTLCLWATHSTSAHLIISAQTLVGCLSVTAVRDTAVDVRREAAEAFGRLAAWIQSPMPAHEAVLRALQELVQTAPAAIVARALKGQAALPNNRTVLTDCPVLMEALVTIAGNVQISPWAREDACTALSHLTSVPTNRPKLASKRLVDALCLNLPTVPAAAEIVVHLAAATDASTMLVFRHESLLKTLIRCAGQPNHPQKQELKQIVLQLVQAL